MRLGKVFAVVSLLVSAVVASAQAPDLSPPKEITDLGWMVGEWSGKVKWTMPGVPEMDMDMSYTVVPEGKFLKTTSHMEIMGMPIHEVGYLGWDAAKKRYTTWCFTNYAAAPRIEHGTIEGSKWVMESEPFDPGSGTPVLGRATTTKVSDSEVTFLLEFKNASGGWDKAAAGTFKKKPKTS